MTSPGQTYTVSIFIEHIIKDLNISRSLVSSLYSAGTLIGSFSLPFLGKQIDRYGARVMVVMVSIFFGFATIFMGAVQNAVMLGIGFILIRMLGQGSLQLVSQTMINQWWVQKRGMIMGISGLIYAILGIGAFPNLVYWLISAFEWRSAFMILGLSLLLVMTPVGYFLFRNRPEKYHMRPDGVEEIKFDKSKITRVQISTKDDWTLKEAIKTRSFWLLIISTSSFGLVSTGLFFHMVSIFDLQGLSPSVVATVFIPVAFATAAANLAGGVLTDRIPLHYLLAFGLLLQGAALLVVERLQGPASALLFGGVLGATGGVSRVIGAIAWPAYYGRKELGSIYGVSAAAGVIGAAIGPIPFGFVYDLTGSYQPVLQILAIACFIFGLISLTLKKPTKANENREN